MNDSQRFPFVRADEIWGDASLMPLVPVILSSERHSLQAQALLDTGATVNVLPYGLGVKLGAVWNPQLPPLRLTGALARFEARPLKVGCSVGRFEALPLIFAWSLAEDIPLIFGHVNFFMEFDVCIYRSQFWFELQPKSNTFKRK